MTLEQIVEQVREERMKAAAHLNTLDAALAALTTKATPVATLTRATPASAPISATRKGRAWTPEQRARLSAIMKKRFAVAKKNQPK